MMPRLESLDEKEIVNVPGIQHLSPMDRTPVVERSQC